MPTEHHIVYFPGLSDHSPINSFFIELLPYFWDSKEFPLHVMFLNWNKGHSFQKKLVKILEEVDYLTARYEYVSLIGKDEGGSAALNTFAARRNELVACINVTGRLAVGKNVYPTLEQAARMSPAFKHSVEQFERWYEPTLAASDRKRVLTMRPRWDEVVPATTVPLAGATNLVVPMIEHMAGGIYSMTWYSWVIKNFLRRKSSNFQRKNF